MTAREAPEADGAGAPSARGPGEASPGRARERATTESVSVRVTAHGPARRLSLSPTAAGGHAQVSVVRVGDVLVDSGGTRVTAALLEALRDDPPRRIVLTHQHEDHVGNVPALRRAFGALPVYAPRALVGVIAATARVPEYRARVWGHPEPTPEAELIPYDAGAVFEAGGLAFEAVATPGHTPPHMALIARHEGGALAISGDLYSGQPLRAWLEAAADDAARSYRAVAAWASAVTLLPTHGRTRPDGVATLLEGAAWLDAEGERVERTAAELGTRDPRAVALHLYGDDPILAHSGGEIGNAVWVRSVLDPVRALPARPV